MPWNDQNGNDDKSPKPSPWGGQSNGSQSNGQGPQRPWGQGAARDDEKGPDLEEMMRRLQSRVRPGHGGGGGGGGGPFKLGGGGFLVVGALALAAWLGSGIYMVNEGESGVVTRFGAYNRLTAPGLHVHLPAPIEDAIVVPVSQQRQTLIGFDASGADRPNESLMLTGDEAIIDVDFTVIWQLTGRPQDYVFNVRDPEELVLAVSESAMREVVGQATFDGVISTQRAQVTERTRVLMQSMLDTYGSGVRVIEVRLRNATAPPPVIDAFNDVDRARADAVSRVNEAEAQAARITQEAAAYKDQVVREASGEATRFNLIYNEYQQNPRVTRERLYLETMERVIGNADKIIVDQRAGAVPYLPLEQLRRSSPAAQPQAGAQQ
jgi:membrane protease subunit HflK